MSLSRLRGSISEPDPRASVRVKWVLIQKESAEAPYDRGQFSNILEQGGGPVELIDSLPVRSPAASASLIQSWASGRRISMPSAMG
jgi:hypothetical protein